MEAEGFSKLSVDRLVTDIGTTRPTFYRRYPSIAHLVFDVVRTRFGTGGTVDSGALRTDLLGLQRERVAMYSSALVRNNLPGLLESLRTDAEVRDLYEKNFVRPRRDNVARLIAAAVERGELSPHAVDDSELACDLLVGPILARTVLPVGSPLDDRLARDTVDVVMARLTQGGRR